MTNHLYDRVFGAHATSSKTFLYTDTGEISFAEFAAITNRIANTLVEAGVTG